MTASASALPYPEDEPLLPLMRAAGPLRLSRTRAYALARDGFPVEVLRQGGRLYVRTSDVRRYLGLPLSRAAA